MRPACSCASAPDWLWPPPDGARDAPPRRPVEEEPLDREQDERNERDRPPPLGSRRLLSPAGALRDAAHVDESLGVGDAAFVDKAKARIRALLERSHVVVVVSHDLGALKEMCTRGLWLKQGRIVADGPIGEVVGRYLAEVHAAG